MKILNIGNRNLNKNLWFILVQSKIQDEICNFLKLEL